MPSAQIIAARSLWYMELVRIHGDAAHTAFREKLAEYRKGRLYDVSGYQPSGPVDFSHVWSHIHDLLQMTVEATSEEDRVSLHADLEDYIGYVRDLLSAKVVAPLKSIKVLIDVIKQLSWEKDGMVLLRTQNNYHNENPTGGYRDFVLHVVVRVPMAEGLRLMLIQRPGDTSARRQPEQTVPMLIELVCTTPTMDLLAEASNLYKQAAKGVYDLFGAKFESTPNPSPDKKE